MPLLIFCDLTSCLIGIVFLNLIWVLCVSVLVLLFYFIVFILIGGWVPYNIILVLPYIDRNLPWVYMRSPSWTPLPPPSPSHPCGSSQCTCPKHPGSCIEPGLAIHVTCDNIHVSMSFSQVSPPSPSPTESKRLLYICVSFAVSHTGLWLTSF